MTTGNDFGRRELNGFLAEFGLGKLNANPSFSNGSMAAQWELPTSKGRFLLRLETAKGEMEIKREIDLLAFLRKHGFPCMQPVADRAGRTYWSHEGGWLGLYKRAAGHALDAEEVSLSQLENVGRVLADLHVVGKGYKKGIDNRYSYDRVAELYKDIRPHLPAYFKKIVRTLDEEVEYLRFYLEGKLPKGIIHGDMFPERMLFKGDKITAILEFDAACRGKYVYDLATAINAFCFEDGMYALERFEALIGGYESLRTLSLAEWDAFPNELRFSAFRFTITRLQELFATAEDGRFRVSRDFEEFYDRLLILRREKEGGMEGLLMAMATGYDYRKYQKVKAVERRSR